jgi:AcrR family transcriptional regulator
MPIEQLRSQQRHQRILDAAAEVFSAKGYHGTLVDEIAAEADTSKGGVYFHFPNKQAIFLALLDRLADILRERVEVAVATRNDPVARAEAALEVVLETFGSHRRLTRLFMVEALGAGPEFNVRMIHIRAAFAALIRVHLDEAVATGAIPPLDTATAASAWFGAINEVVTQWALAEEPGRLEDVYPTIRALLLRGIRARTEADAR